MAATNGNNLHGSGTTAAATPAGRQRRRSPWPLAITAALFIIVPFAFWYGTWFGRPLKDEELAKYLADEKNPRHGQHALAQLAERITRGETGVERWHPQVLTLAASPVTDLRMTAAWVMGEEHRSEEFRAALVRLLEDEEPIVRRNAALALVRFGDAGGRAELRAMLQPFTVKAAFEGTAQTVLPEGTEINREAMIAQFIRGDNSRVELRAPLPGKISKAFVRSGDRVGVGSDLLILAPDAESVWEALRALYLCGEAEDLADVERYAGGVEGMPERIKQQAALTAEAIKRRAARRPESISEQ